MGIAVVIPVPQPAPQILTDLARLFQTPVHDRHVTCVVGSYASLRSFQARIITAIADAAFSPLGRVLPVSLIGDLFDHLASTGRSELAERLAERRHDDRLRALLSEAYRDLITRRIEAEGVLGLVVSDFELLYAYGLGGHDLSLLRQVAINGKRACLLVPGAFQDGRLWIFDHDPEARAVFPAALVDASSGRVFVLEDR